MKLGSLVISTVFAYRGMTLRKGSTNGPCSRDTNKAVFPSGKQKNGFVIGTACAPKLGGQFQTSEELQVWVPNDAEVEV